MSEVAPLACEGVCGRLRFALLGSSCINWLRDWGLGLRVYGEGFRVEGSRLGVEG